MAAAGDELPTEDVVVGDELRCGPWMGEEAAAGDEVWVQCGAWTGEDAAAGDDASTPRRAAPGFTNDILGGSHDPPQKYHCVIPMQYRMTLLRYHV
ncbi:Os05g0189550 [Oryza sativa Japonica Group]|uniref:Os05g0189550 protein n=1 Tax=Oryza sativa subsp. japonica TaxID=39947 RepID=A0A0P0WIV7_ORYSJ|nr:Os05g0189550 [Oryza sativa Japonica Group]